MKKIISVLAILIAIPTFSQEQLNSSEIKLALKKLNTLGSVLYVAAHPDDENTRLIAYMANEKMARTAYLSLTRGDGGQNLVGTEKGSLMGLLRTQELLEARKTDGGEQFFTRAVDFGYSKTADETFVKWDRKKVLGDVVWTIRKFKPDVIITRFPPTKAAGHGHHTASAILAEEAFDLAGDPTAYPEQLEHVSVWQPKRMFVNASSWWDKALPEKAKKSPEKYTTYDIGAYNPLLGKSYSEIASESRTMHKSQGFGSSKQRGSKIEYLQLIKGDKITSDIFDDVNISWSKIKGGNEVEKLLSKVNHDFNPEQPEKIVPVLLQAYQLINELPEGNWKSVKLSAIKKVIASCAGLFVEVTADDYSASSNSMIEVTTTSVNRSNLKFELIDVKYGKKDTTINATLKNNEPLSFKNKILTPSHKNTNPYWLNHQFEGIYTVDNPTQIGDPENSPIIPVTFSFKINDINFDVVRSVEYKWTDRVKGELYRPFVVLPKVTANISDNVYIFASDEAKEVIVTLKGHQKGASGNVSLSIPKGWTSNPQFVNYEFHEKNEEKIIVFKVIPSSKENVGNVTVLLNGKKGTKSLTTIEYDHIKTQTLLPDAQAKLVRLNVVTKGKNIGYINGAGDEIPLALEQLGYQVTMLDEASIKSNNLSQYDAIVTGIRAHNTNKYMKSVYGILMDYVKNGGNYVIQYNTNRRVDTKIIGPYPLKLSRDRITVEEAKTTFLAPEHAILNTPNKILATDFDNWIQERGLYFPNEWDKNYTPILGWSDPKEEMIKGGLLVSNYGKGSFIYTGISFFRELPAGVPGAFKLFANIISYRK